MYLKTEKLFVKAFVYLVLFVLTTSTVFAIDGVWHKPYGIDDLYTVELAERYPRDPIAGENVYIKLSTWPVEAGQATWITWTKNGIAQSDIGGSWQYNSGNNTYWEVNMGSFSKGDVISYTVKANKNGANEKSIGPFSFTVTDWESVSSISGHTDSSNHIVLDAVPNTGTLSPKINIAFTADDVFRVQLSPTGTGTMAAGLSNYTLVNYTDYLTVTTSDLQLVIDKSPFKLNVYKSDGTTLIAKQYDSTINRNMAWLTDGSSIINKIEDHFYSPTSEEFYGFGERYNDLSKRGQDIDIHVYNQYQSQNDRTYLSIPFFINTKGYGIFLNSTYYSKFRMATDKSDMYGFTADTGGSSTSMLDYYFIYGSNMNDVVTNYTDITSKPTMLPKWAFGLWMSANEWDRESEVDAAITNAANNDIPATAVVLEQWSDENTFYIFNDSTYTPVSGGSALGYNDFTFGSKWPNPKQMVSDIHDEGINVIMWQVPVLKYTSYAYTQKDNDESYMISQGYDVDDGNGGQYRTPEGTWFGNSLLLDFTNASATNWWMSKRAYLFDDVDIDGFKTDGGEMVWGRDVSFSNGKNGDEMRNQYPNEYIKGYNDYALSKNSDAVSFSRAGTSGAQKYQIFWAGDQASSFSAYQDAVRAGLTANISGVPFWGWDLAGFTGSFPSAELYKRSIAMAAFSPVMQFHSEKSNPSPSEERSPWNVATRTGDSSVITTSSKFVNTRMNLLPYIFSEAQKSSDSGKPMMRAMVMDYPTDTNTFDLDAQYMFGDHLLVAPIVVQGQTDKNIYLPEGEWIDFWFGAHRPGGRNITYYADVNSLPVFVKSGAIIPMNLNADYELGGTIGNSLTTYNNLTFRIYPNGTTVYSWNDDIGGGIKTITSTEEYNLNKETVSFPAVPSTTTLQVYTTRPSSVTVGGIAWTDRTSLANLQSNTTGWYYDSIQKLTYVKVASSVSTRSIVLNGVDKVEYEAEFAEHINVTTNTNHPGYTGTGFVDGFASTGDAVLFDVFAKSSGSYTLDVRYSSGGGTASRAIYVNSSKITDLSLPQTANWDTWDTASTTISLNAGHNSVWVQYDVGSSSLGINLDNIKIKP